MKPANPNRLSTRFAIALALAGAAGSAWSQDIADAAPASRPVPEKEMPAPKSSYWGLGVGMVFSEIPISDAPFKAPLSHLYYSWILSDPQANFRTAATLGVWGFGLVLPVPKASVEGFLGGPHRDIQGKFGVGGFYDLVVGGHGGVSLEAGVRIVDRFDVSFITVPFGTDSKRDYLEFVGMRSRDEDENRNGVPDYQETPHVKMPYFGIMLGVAF